MGCAIIKTEPVSTFILNTFCMEETKLALFHGKEIRKIFYKEEWWFSVADVVETLTDSVDVKQYIKKLRSRDEQLNANWGTICTPLELIAPDGKKRETNCANTEGIFRIIQSVPSPKAEPLKLWLAKVGYERVQEMADPEKSLNRAHENWKKYGRSEKWIQQRMTGQETRNKLTDYWKDHDVKEGEEFAILTNIIHEEWAEVSVKQHKQMKGLKSQNLRDHMSEAELIFTALAELSTRQIAETQEAVGLQRNALAGKQGGSIAKNARLALEQKTGKKVVTGKNFLPLNKQRKRLKSK